MSETWPKCWGKNTEVYKNSSCSVNILDLIKGGVCSWHSHKHKHNTFYLISGKVLIKTEFNETLLRPGNSISVFASAKHLFEVLEDSKMVEVMYVEYQPADIDRVTEGYMKKDV